MKKLLNAGPSEAGWHRLQSVLQCPRKYALEQEAEWEWSEALIKGSLMHIGLAHYYMLLKDPEGDWCTPVEAVGQLALTEYESSGDQQWLDHAEMVNQVVAEYVDHYRGEHWKVLQVEEELRSQVHDEVRGEKYLYTQRPDLIVEDKHGKVWIVDHKTTYRATGRTLKRYILSGQFLGYKLLGRGYFGEKFAGVVQNMIQWPTKGRKHGATFSRPTLAAAPRADKDHKQTLLYAERIIRDHQHLTNPMDWPAVHHETACITPYGVCPFHETCQWGN